MFNFSFLITVLALCLLWQQMHYPRLDAPCQVGRDLLMGNPQESLGAWAVPTWEEGSKGRRVLG